MSKLDEDNWTVYTDDDSYSKITKAGNAGMLLWIIFGVVSFWEYDWGISWGQVVTFVSGIFFGYWMALSWVRGHAGRWSA